MVPLHAAVHAGLARVQNPVAGAALGAAGGAAAGAAAVAKSLTLGAVVGSIESVGVAATAGLLATGAAPIVVPMAGCCAVVGTVYGLGNWLQADGPAKFAREAETFFESASTRFERFLNSLP